jgi:hypothetical protein
MAWLDLAIEEGTKALEKQKSEQRLFHYQPYPYVLDPGGSWKAPPASNRVKVGVSEAEQTQLECLVDTAEEIAARAERRRAHIEKQTLLDQQRMAEEREQMAARAPVVRN